RGSCLPRARRTSGHPPSESKGGIGRTPRCSGGGATLRSESSIERLFPSGLSERRGVRTTRDASGAYAVNGRAKPNFIDLCSHGLHGSQRESHSCVPIGSTGFPRAGRFGPLALTPFIPVIMIEYAANE